MCFSLLVKLWLKAANTKLGINSVHLTKGHKAHNCRGFSVSQFTDTYKVFPYTGCEWENGKLFDSKNKVAHLGTCALSEKNHIFFSILVTFIL